MSRFYRKPALLIFALFAGVTLLIRAQPYDAHEIRGLLIPEGCEMPCFMGIHPGVTTVDEAVEILKASGWADNFQSSIVVDPNQSGTISWEWNGAVSLLMQGKESNILSATGNVVTHIYISTAASLGDIWLSMGTPSKYGLRTAGMMAKDVIYYHFYSDHDLGVTGRVVCSYLVHLWETPVTIYLTQPDDHTFLAVTIQDTFFRRHVMDLGRQICKG